MTKRAKAAAFSRAGEFEERKAKGAQLAREASAALKRAGFSKAGPYRAFSLRTPGYVAAEYGNGTCDEPTACVMLVGTAARDAEAVLCALQAAGRFVVTQTGWTMFLVTRAGAR